MAVVTITLYVNTGSITQNTIDANSNFGQSRDITNANYTVAVTAGDTVVWKGVSSSNPTTDVVKIS